MKVSVIGAGNVANHLIPALQQNDISIVQVYSRTFEHAKSLAKRTNATAIKSIEEMTDKVDVILLMTPDDIIEDIALSIPPETVQQAVIAHTSGGRSSKILKPSHHKYGCFYPLQSFSKQDENIEFDKIPMLITGNKHFSQQISLELARAIHPAPQLITDDQRAQLHVAAVFANNFTNHLLKISQDLLAKKQLDFDLLFPLIEKTVEKLKTITPKNAQTGPAARDDQQTIEQHLSALSDEEVYQNIYKILTDSIQNDENT